MLRYCKLDSVQLHERTTTAKEKGVDMVTLTEAGNTFEANRKSRLQSVVLQRPLLAEPNRGQLAKHKRDLQTSLIQHHKAESRRAGFIRRQQLNNEEELVLPSSCKNCLCSPQ